MQKKRQADLLRNFTFTLVTNRMLAISEAVGDFGQVELILDRRAGGGYLVVVLLDVRASVARVSWQLGLIDAESWRRVVQVRWWMVVPVCVILFVSIIDLFSVVVDTIVMPIDQRLWQIVFVARQGRSQNGRRNFQGWRWRWQGQILVATVVFMNVAELCRRGFWLKDAWRRRRREKLGVIELFHFLDALKWFLLGTRKIFVDPRFQHCGDDVRSILPELRVLCVDVQAVDGLFKQVSGFMTVCVNCCTSKTTSKIKSNRK